MSIISMERRETALSGAMSHTVMCTSLGIVWLLLAYVLVNNRELKQVTFLTTRTLTGSKFDVFDQSRQLLQPLCSLLLGAA